MLTFRLSHVRAALVAACLLITALQLATDAHAANITVNSAADNANLAMLAGNGCSLREAIANANDTNGGPPDYPDCAVGSNGPDTISFSGVSSITVVDEIFVIT
ncbi:MAG: CSLREA domain-containing protein, partial [Oligoflexia bacterium]|nr:CSLREA domain-containing protein [Oligoflexia bacterium]